MTVEYKILVYHLSASTGAYENSFGFTIGFVEEPQPLKSYSLNMIFQVLNLVRR